MVEHTETLIVGAGPTGLTLACELARAGRPFRLVESSPGSQAGCRGKGVQPRTLEVFEDLGVADRVLAVGRMAMPMHTIDANGRVTHGGEVPTSLRQRPDVPYPASLVTPQWRVEEALRLRLAELGGAVEFGVTATAVDQTDDAVSAVLHTGAATERVTARWLVGCDGGHSMVRKQAGIAFHGETRDRVRMLVADLAVDGLDRDVWRIWPHADGLFALCPLPSTELFCYQAGIAPDAPADLSLANLQAICAHRTGRDDIRLREPEWSSLWRANVRLAERYRAGRVFLAGDAAHVHSPAGGQGMNTGIQDAHNLAWKLAAVAAGTSPELLDSYEAERRPIAAGVLGLSDELLRRALDDNAVPIHRNASTSQLDVTYRGSALVGDDRAEAATPRAGDRAPDAPGLAAVDGVFRLFELIGGGRFTVLAFPDAPTLEQLPTGVRVLRVVASPSGPGEVGDTGGHLAAAYGAGERTLVVIRPDGHIGWVSDAGDSSAVRDYLTPLLGAQASKSRVTASETA